MELSLCCLLWCPPLSGHSLGGAVAKLCALRLLRQLRPDADVEPPPITCITFACTAVGNRELGAMVTNVPCYNLCSHASSALSSPLWSSWGCMIAIPTQSPFIPTTRREHRPSPMIIRGCFPPSNIHLAAASVSYVLTPEHHCPPLQIRWTRPAGACISGTISSRVRPS